MGDMNFGDNKMVNKEHDAIPSSFTDSWIELSGREPKLKMEYKEGWTIAGKLSFVRPRKNLAAPRFI